MNNQLFQASIRVITDFAKQREANPPPTNCRTTTITTIRGTSQTQTTYEMTEIEVMFANARNATDHMQFTYPIFEHFANGQFTPSITKIVKNIPVFCKNSDNQTDFVALTVFIFYCLMRIPGLQSEFYMEYYGRACDNLHVRKYIDGLDFGYDS